MNRLVIVCLIALAALTACKPDVVCNTPYIQVGTSCCLDRDGNDICDNDEVRALKLAENTTLANATEQDLAVDVILANDTVPVNLAFPENSSLNSSAIILENISVGIPANVSQEALSITEEYERVFWMKANKSYCFTSEDPYYGRIFFWGSGDLLKVTAPQYLFIIDNITNTINATNTDTNLYNPMRERDIREHKVNFVDYVWWNTTTDEIGACYVSFYGPAGTYYVKQNCVEDNSTNPDGSMTNRQIIWSNLTFAKTPVLPRDWLRKFHGQEPMKVQYNRTYIEEDWNVHVQVDYLFFDNHDGTITKMYVHQGYRMPMRIETLKDGKVISYQRYRGIGINDLELSTYYGTFTGEV